MIFWCKKCNEPIFDKSSHACDCDGEMELISEGTVCNPVFIQERKLLSYILNENLVRKQIWYLGSSRYYFDGKTHRVPYVKWYTEKKHLKYAEKLRNNIEIERDYSFYHGVVKI